MMINMMMMMMIRWPAWTPWNFHFVHFVQFVSFWPELKRMKNENIVVLDFHIFDFCFFFAGIER